MLVYDVPLELCPWVPKATVESRRSAFSGVWAWKAATRSAPVPGFTTSWKDQATAPWHPLHEVVKMAAPIAPLSAIESTQLKPSQVFMPAQE